MLPVKLFQFGLDLFGQFLFGNSTDRTLQALQPLDTGGRINGLNFQPSLLRAGFLQLVPVSYTHLTLPTKLEV